MAEEPPTNLATGTKLSRLPRRPSGRAPVVPNFRRRSPPRKGPTLWQRASPRPWSKQLDGIGTGPARAGRSFVLGGLRAAVTTKEVPGSPGHVWNVLADGSQYAEWVVGANRIRDVESDWPAVGSRFHHTVGIWPLHLRDNTVVKECEPGHRLVLEARARPVGRARVEMTLLEIPTGTRIVMTEEAISPTVARWSSPLLAPLIHVRNVEALRRLADLCEESESADPRPAVSDSVGRRRGLGSPPSALDDELASSFPASDPPAGWSGPPT